MNNGRELVNHRCGDNAASLCEKGLCLSLSLQPRIDLWYFLPITRRSERQNELLVVVLSEIFVC